MTLGLGISVVMDRECNMFIACVAYGSLMLSIAGSYFNGFVECIDQHHAESASVSTIINYYLSLSMFLFPIVSYH